MKKNNKKTNRLFNVIIDIIAGAIIVGIIAFFLIGEPVGNPEEKTTVVTTVETTTAAITEFKNSVTTAPEETTISFVEETTTEVVEEKTTEIETTTEVEETTKEVVTVAATPNLRAEAGRKYSDADVYLLAQILYCEAGGVSRAEMARVGKVVLNRVNTDYHEFANCNTINQVLRQPGQYPETVAKIDNGIKPSQDALEVAEGLLSGTIQVSELSEDVLWQTGFVPDWQVRVVYQSGCHYYSVLA